MTDMTDRTRPFYLPLIYRLRRMGVPVGTQEAVALGEALAQ